MSHIDVFSGNVYQDSVQDGLPGLCVWNGESTRFIAAPGLIASSLYDYGGGAFAVGRAGLFAMIAGQLHHYHETWQPLLSADLGDLRVQGDFLLGIVGGEPVSLFIWQIGTDKPRFLSLPAGVFAKGPCLSPQAGYLAHVEWPVGWMCWEQGQLVITELASGDRQLVRGAWHNCQQVLWLDEWHLLLIAEVDNWWQVLCYDRRTQAVTPWQTAEREAGVSLWQLGCQYLVANDEAIWLADQYASAWQLHRISASQQQTLPMPCTVVDQMAAEGCTLALTGGGAGQDDAVYLYRRGQWFDQAPQQSRLPTTLDSPQGARLWLYDNHPQPRYVILHCHGGPSGQHRPSQAYFDDGTGLCFCSLDFRGSSGYGRRMREVLMGQWGVVDVEDGLWAMTELKKRYPQAAIFLQGRSASAWTCLLLAQRFTVAGVALRYPVIAVDGLIEHASSFERGYLQRLLPQHFADLQDKAMQQSTRLLIQHGVDDQVVPLQGVRDSVKIWQQQGVDVTLYEYADQGHGFWGEAKKRAQAREMAFMTASV